MSKSSMLLLIYFLVHTTMVQGFTGKDLKTACDSGDRYVNGGSGFKEVGDAYSGGECLGYIHGINDGLPQDEVCPTLGVTVGEEVKVVRKFLKEHPGLLHHPAAQLVKDALSVQYPCGHENPHDPGAPSPSR